MDHYCAPQWVDFSSSPQVPCDDYFEKFHDIYKPNICTNITKNKIKIRKNVSEIIETPNKSMQLQVKDFIKSIPNLDENYKIEIDNLKSTPIKVIYPLKHNSGKHEVLKEVTYDNVLIEAIQNFQFGANLQKVQKEMDLSSTEKIFKKPMPIKNKISKPVRICEMDTSSISVSSNEEEIKSKKSSNVNMIKRNKTSSIKITENVTNISQTIDYTTSNEKYNIVENDHSRMKIDNKNIKLKSSTVKQQTSVIRAATSTRVNTVNRFVTIRRQKEKEESKYKTVRTDHSKSTQRQHHSIDSSVSLEKVTQKNINLSSLDSIVNNKRMPKSCNSSIIQEKTSYQKKTPFKKIISAVVGNTGSEIIIKREKILFFDIPIHTKQKKVTRPVPFSFENRDKIKKQLKLEQESKGIKSESITNTKSVSDFNKTQKHINKFGNITRKKVTSFISNTVMNEKDKGTKQSEKSEKVQTSRIQSVTIRKPLRTTNALKGNNYERNEDKTGKKKNEDIQNKVNINKNKNPLNSISYKNTNIHKNLKTQPKEKVHTSRIQSVSIRLPLRTTNVLKGNNHEKNEDKTGKKKNEDIQNKENINKSKNTLNSISCKNINIHKNSKIQAKEKLQINKYIPKENVRPNINMSTKLYNTLNQNKGTKLKSTIVKSSTNDREKKHEIEERMRQRRIMHEEKLKREREAKLAKEKLEIAKLRQQTEIKAKPMPIYKSLIQIKSAKPLTQPQSPAWRSTYRVSRIEETS